MQHRLHGDDDVIEIIGSRETGTVEVAVFGGGRGETGVQGDQRSIMVALKRKDGPIHVAIALRSIGVEVAGKEAQWDVVRSR